MLVTALSEQGMISITPVTMMLGTVTENLQLRGFVTPEMASSEMDAAPSQY